MNNTLQEQVYDLCKLADAVIAHPEKSIRVSAENIGVCSSVYNFICENPFTWYPILTSPILWPIFYFKKKKREREEKERMLREIIKKQQAIIQELEKKEKKTEQEIENLKKMLQMLQEAEQKVAA